MPKVDRRCQRAVPRWITSIGRDGRAGEAIDLNFANLGHEDQVGEGSLAGRIGLERANASRQESSWPAEDLLPDFGVGVKPASIGASVIIEHLAKSSVHAHLMQQGHTYDGV
jgi:hypothetical protein